MPLHHCNSHASVLIWKGCHGWTSNINIWTQQTRLCLFIKRSWSWNYLVWNPVVTVLVNFAVIFSSLMPFIFPSRVGILEHLLGATGAYHPNRVRVDRWNIGMLFILWQFLCFASVTQNKRWNYIEAWGGHATTPTPPKQNIANNFEKKITFRLLQFQMYLGTILHWHPTTKFLVPPCPRPNLCSHSSNIYFYLINLNHKNCKVFTFRGLSSNRYKIFSPCY